MTLDEWMYEEEQRLMNGIESWKKFLENKENRENKVESEVENDKRRSDRRPRMGQTL